MATQLEVIHPNGDIVFHPLDGRHGVLNIGRHPDNDVVLQDGSVDLFHALLDTRQSPFQLLIMADPYSVGGAGVGTAQQVGMWEPIPLGAYTLIIISETREAPPVIAPLPKNGERAPTPPSEAETRILPEVESPTQTLVPAGGIAPLPAATIPTLSREALTEQEDDTILATLETREWDIVVEQTASGEIIITNGGPLVANFDVYLEGIPADWVLLLPREVNLNEGERGKIEFDITPPRLPSSRAGSHRFAIVVTSPNYPRHMCRRIATLTIQPYFEFAVGDIQPRQQTIGGAKPLGNAEFVLANYSNTSAAFRIEGADEEHACTFEFGTDTIDPSPDGVIHIPDEAAGETLVETSAWQTGQVQWILTPNEVATIPLRIAPIRPPYIGLRPRTLAYTVTAGMVENPQYNRSLLAQVRVRPRIGPGYLLLFLLSLAAIIILIFYPRIQRFTVEPTAIRAGETVVINGEASLFTFLRLNGQPIESNIFQQEDRPLENISYELTGENWLSRLIPIFAPEPHQVTVTVDTIRPSIVRFTANGGENTSILMGDSLELAWDVSMGLPDGAELILSVNGEPLDAIPEEEQRLGRRAVEPLEGETLYTLTATNIYGTSSRTVRVFAAFPTPTPVPPPPLPEIILFSVEPGVVLQGDPVSISWNVEGAEAVQISGVPDALPPTGANFRIVPNGTTNFVLSASNGQPDGTVISAPQQVIVNPRPTETPVPLAPVISAFQATYEEVVYGEVNDLQITWTVDGEYTDITLSNPFLGDISGLPSQGTIPVNVPPESTFYVLTARNGDETASSQIRLNVIIPTPTPTYTTTPTQTPTLTPTPTSTTTPTPTITPSPVPPTLTPTVTPSSTPHPLPNLTYFTAGIPQGGDPSALTQIGAQGNVLTYRAIAGTVVELEWDVQVAETVTIDLLGQRPPNGTEIIPPLLQAVTYRLTAENPGGVVDAFIQFEVIAPDPPPPNGLSGYISEGNTVVTWLYSATEQPNIVGFRVYRADAPPGTDFTVIADESVLPATARLYEDPGVVCDYAYYLVAVYYDPRTNRNLETDPSDTSYYSPPCDAIGTDAGTLSKRLRR
jgi:hypothetical protein